MKPRILQCAFYIVLIFTLASCVSKKKYAQLETEKKTTLTQKDSLMTVMTKKLAVNDSLTAELVKKDSIIDSLSGVIVDIQSKRDKPKTTASKKPKTITKEEEYDRKAQFIYNFASYIEWPIVYNGTDFIIGVAGDDELVQRVQSTLSNKKVSSKKIKVEKYNKTTKYHVLFVIPSSYNAFVAIKNDVKKNKTVLVSDDYALFSLGAHISFSMDGDKIKYTINKPAIEKIGLKVGHELMRFSE
ncbi:MAG: YfiR family protein [Bacteroidetes bacterium]|nr:YfiR family protein [Bacteroidota bacterium]